MQSLVSVVPLLLLTITPRVLMTVSYDQMLNDAEEASTFAFISFALVAFVIYEHLLTAVLEVRTLWSQSYNVISFFLLSNRYLSIAYAFSAMSATIVQDCESWLIATIIECICYALLSVILALLVALRVYAICNRNGWFFILILALGLIPTVTNLYYSANLKISLTPDAGCVPLQSSSAAVSSSFAKITRISAIMLDFIVLASTWARLSPLWSQLRFNGHSVPSILLRNGCSYFLTLLLLNIAEIVVFQLTEVTYITYFIPPITSSPLSRFIIELRRSQRSSISCALATTQTDSMSALSSLVSDLGQDFSHGLPLNGDNDSSDVHESLT